MRVSENLREEKQEQHNLPKKEMVRKTLKKMIELLEKEAPISQKYPFCATSHIQYYSHLRTNCLKKYEELYTLKCFDIRQKKLLEYLKEGLNRMPQEEAEYNRQLSLLACQTILKREEKNEVLKC
ncbi:hypothetical protein [endosymbiont GvMRE of Glomus versiforme]|uniref:hypothetical protein n=1 Tax=endosymbiont GvMRE of Glomus versiforme TaxID=2039283 RepID=UPI000EEEE76C|nr:hypothetical protein [endosymbiont GvMRE of Glomus versiforme]RHZ36279.1 hypothetical protein GvMRE_Ic1g63 [endosymbiont GvMRE of Glomus versiforme]RHZ37485.1 hypothetical protein GvMRE_I1g705 [endosymbiont GvMRE of Glomus versiforme]